MTMEKRKIKNLDNIHAAYINEWMEGDRVIECNLIMIIRFNNSSTEALKVINTCCNMVDPLSTFSQETSLHLTHFSP
jgi:hypothetical protein